MSKFINPKADARQGAFLAVKVNSLNSSRVLCSLSSLSLLMAQSSPHLSQRMSQVRYCPGSDTTVPTGNANRFEISFSPDLSHRLIDLDIWFLSHSLLGTTTFHLARKDSLPISTAASDLREPSSVFLPSDLPSSDAHVSHCLWFPTYFLQLYCGAARNFGWPSLLKQWPNTRPVPVPGALP